MTITSLPILFQRRNILPDGRLPIRIAPGTQMDTLKMALDNGGMLGICMYDPDENQHFYEMGTRVKIEDFDAELVDGLLQVTVIGVDVFEADAFLQAENGVCIADGKTLERWPETELSMTQQLLADRLQIMYDKYPALSELHDDKQLTNLSWLCQRWLEILPVPLKDKQWLLARPSCADTCDYLMSMMNDPH
uniref:LON peptidase substrate-binding domain-containing protein n=1 Tax=Thaumasiovibrio occultus TaxID=1891184 RepID=UPI000B35CBAD|nr:LON peptidase substrate-binding domain-containing protein [Thaumasiovibrio occultus]